MTYPCHKSINLLGKTSDEPKPWVILRNYWLALLTDNEMEKDRKRWPERIVWEKIAKTEFCRLKIR